jgi:ActR/RegA family two-component response regulator
MADTAGGLVVAGSLKDVSVSDVMQFIHLGRRTGTLRLAHDGGEATIGFHNGKLVSADAPHTPSLGELLLGRGAIATRHLEAALVAHRRNEGRRSLGQILAASGKVKPEALHVAVEEQVRLAVAEVLTWDNGNFEFVLGDRPVEGDVVLHPSEVLPSAEINTQMVLLEASRIFDEKNRQTQPITPPVRPPAAGAPPRSAAAQEPAPEDPPTFLLTARELQEALVGLEARGPRSAADLLELQLVSADEVFTGRVQRALENDLARVRVVAAGRAGEAVLGAPPPLVVIDLRAGGVHSTVVAAIHRTHPRASLIAVADLSMPATAAYAAGVLAVVPPEIEAVVACIGNVIESRRDLIRGRRPAETTSSIDRLRRLFGDLRSGMMSANMALALMHTISESVERAVLFLVKRDQLAVLGAFGCDEQGRHLAMLTRGLRLPLTGGNALAAGVASGQVASLSFDDARLPEPFRSYLGRPRSGQVMVFPLLGAQGVVAVVYADNGRSDEPIQDLDILELATTQAGVALENELLRREIHAGEKP